MGLAAAGEGINRSTRSTPTRERRGSRWNEVGSDDPRWTGRIHGNAIDRARVDSRVSSSRSRRLRLLWLSLWGDCCFSALFRPFSKNWIQLFVFHHILLTEPHTSGSRRFSPLTRNPLSRTRTFLHVRVPAGYHWTPRTSSAKVMRIFRQLSRPLRYVIRSSRPFPSRRIDPRVPSIRNPRRGFVGFAPPVTTWKGFARRRRSPSSPVVSR